MKPAILIGLGNVLMGDDSFGPTMLARLKACWSFDPACELVDAGTSGQELPELLAGRPCAVLIDVIRSAGRPGELRWLDARELMDIPQEERLGPHDPAFGRCLQTLKLLDQLPQKLGLLGVIPADLGQRIRLSPQLLHALPLAETLLQRRLNDLGIQMSRKSIPARIDVWWEESTCMS